LRRENPELFREGIYESINFGGAFADCAIGFVRRYKDRAIIVIVPRLSSRVGFPPIGDQWQDTHVVLPSGMSNLRDVFSDRKVRVENSQLRLTVAMSQLPFAVLQS
jgi:(1->4)-alpha-D-glucan 1-alpha-D-glucosylmutase